MEQFALANGLIVDTATGAIINPNASADKVEKAVAREKHAPSIGRDRSNKPIRISIGELPADPRACTTVGIVWLYWSMGLSDYDIRDATGLTLAQIESVKGLSLFNQIQNIITNNLSKLGEEDMLTRIASLAPRAMDEMESVLNDSEVDVNAKVRVAESLLDRAGFGAKQITEHRHKVEGGLLIRYVEETVIDAKKIPQINIDREGATDA